LPPVTITERRPQSLHHEWVPGANNDWPAAGVYRGQSGANHYRGATVTHHIRFLGPRDFVWNLSPEGTGLGLEPLGGFRIQDVNHSFAPEATRVIGNNRYLLDNSWSILRHYIDPPTGRPALILEVTVPNRRGHPWHNELSALRFHNLALVPTRDVQVDDVYIDIDFGLWGGAALGIAGLTWTPMPTLGELYVPNTGTGFATITNQQTMAALMSVGRGVINPTTGQPRNNNNVPPNPAEVAAAITAFGGVQLNAWQEAGLSWFPTGGETVSYEDTWRNRGSAWSGNKHVGTRGDASLEMTVYGDIPTLISGQRNFPTAMTLPNADPFNAANNRYAGSRTARVQIREIIPGAFNTGWAEGVVDLQIAPIRGVQLMHAQWRITTPGGAPGAVGWQNVSFREDDWLNPADAIGVPTITTDTLRLFIPRDDRPDVTRTLEVVFFVSIVAGYEHMFNEPIDVIALEPLGSALTNLAANNRRETIAYVEDPITVALIGDIVQMYVGQVMSPVEVTPIGDIIISETARGRLARGTTFTLGIEAIPIPVLGGHALVGTTVIHDDSGLEVRAAQIGDGHTAQMLFEVIRESQVEGGGTIRLTNNHVMGTFLPGITYGISVNANPRAAWPQPANIDRNPIAQNTSRGLIGRGNFDEIPYFIEIVKFHDWIYPGLPPGVGDPTITEPGDTGDQRPTFSPLTLTDGMTVHTVNHLGEPITIAPAVLNHVITPGQNSVLVIAVRAFSDHIGADINWNPATSEITLTGLATGGHRMTVVLTVGSNQATIIDSRVGVPITADIATWVISNSPTGASSGDPTTVRPVTLGGSNFLPVRFLGYLFGFDVVWNNAIQQAVLTPRG